MAVDETARGDMLPAVQQRPVAPELDRLARLGQWLAASEAARTDMNTKGAEAALRFYYAEQLELPPIYFAHEREVFRRDGMLYAASEYVERMDGEEPFVTSVRFRTVGDMTCTGGVESTASTIDAVVEEIAATRVTERGETRADDRFSEAAMEDRKRVGYF